MLSPFVSAPLCALVAAAGVQLGGDVLGRAPGFPGFLSGSFLGPLALATSRRAPPTAATAAVPLTTGAAALALGAELRSPGFFTFFGLDASPGLLAVPGPSDFMAAAAFSESLLVLCTGGLSGAARGHFTAFGCELLNTGFLPSRRLSPLSIASARIRSRCLADRLSHPCVWRTA